MSNNFNNMFKMSPINNYNQAFQPNTNFIPQMDYTNKNELMHNNINSNVMSEMITEIGVHIDSEDRDKDRFTNPFNFIITFGGVGTSSKTKHFRNGRALSNSEATITYGGQPEPRIERNFMNLKYVRLKCVLLPRYVKYNVDVSGSDASGSEYRTYSTVTVGGTLSALYRYLLLRIKELDNNRYYSSGNNFRSNCFILIKDKGPLDAITDVWISTQPLRTFYNSALKSLNRLTVELLDPSGNQIYFKSVDADTSTTSNLDLDDLNNPNDDTSNFSTFSKSTSMSFELELGVCESEINIQKSYK